MATLGDLISAFRDETQDTRTDEPLWSDRLLIRYAVESMHEACRRAGLLIDSQSSMCLVSATPSDPMIKLDGRVLSVLRIVLEDVPDIPLVRMSVTDMDSRMPGWERSSASCPIWYVEDYQTGYLRLVPSLTYATNLRMTVSRLPLEDPAKKTDAIEIRMEYVNSLVQWMLYRAYSRQDADSFDPKKAATALAEFEREFGKKTSARNASWRLSSPRLIGQPLA